MFLAVWYRVLMELGRELNISVLFLSLACAISYSAEATPSSPLHFRRITPEKGLPGAEVLCIHQDSRGFIWFGTGEGLAQYDGSKIRTFRHNRDHPDSIANNVIWDIVEDDHHNLWLATDSGLEHWSRDSERFSHFLPQPNDSTKLDSIYARKLLHNEDGSLWIATQGSGLNHFDPRTGKCERFMHIKGDTNSPSGDWMLCLYQDRQGLIWIGTEAGGLNQFDPVNKRFTAYRHDPKDPRSLSNDHVTGICEDREGYLWVSTDWGLSRLNPERDSFERFLFEQTGPDIIMPPRIKEVIVDGQGRVWAGTIGGGLLLYDAATRSFNHFRQEVSDPYSLVSDHVTTLFEDNSGGLWIGHYPSGISYADRCQSFRHYRADPGQTNSLSKNSVSAFWEEPSGNLWVGTDGGGLNYLNRATGQWTVYRHDYFNPDTLGGNEIMSLFQDSKGRFWVGTWNGGLDLFNPASGSAKHYRHEPNNPQSLSHRRTWRILEDSHEQLWIATIGGGINRYIPGTDSFVHYRHDPTDPRSLNHDNVWSLLSTRKGDLWAGTSAGLGKLSHSTASWQRYVNHPDQLDSLSHNMVVDLLEDRSGAIWAATYGGGISMLDPATGKFVHFGMKDGLPSDVVTAILEDNDGIIWISTINGLARLNGRTGQLSTYDESNGLQGRHFSRNARLRLRSGELAFGGSQGFNLFDPRKIEPYTIPPPVVLTRFEAFNELMLPGAAGSVLQQSISETRLLEIPARLSVISFEFAALNYRAPEKNQYLYKLHGFDRDWRKSGPERRATYTNLDPGNYRFQVKASNNEGFWNEAGISLELVVIPPWWSTWTFRSIVFVVSISLLIAIVRAVSHSRLKRQLLESEQKRQLAEERKRAQEERLELERKMQEIQKLESLGVLAGGVAHDFNNQLMVILGHTSLALEELPAAHPIRESLDEIRNSSQKAADLCRQMLAYAGKGRYVIEPIELNTLIRGMLNLVRTSISKKAAMQLNLGENLPRIPGDAGQIRQIVTNLIINASEALGDNQGWIRISTGANRFSHSDLHQNFLDYSLPDGIYAWLEVADSGCGMEAETRARVFEPFFTTKFMGRGLGLAAVLGIVRGHKGSISVQSEPGKGSTIRICFPTETQN